MAFREIMETQTLIGDPDDFAIGYAFVGDERTTEIALFSKGENLLGFTREGCHYTTRWLYLEGIVAWLKDFSCNVKEDPFPIDVGGSFANERVAAAFESGPEDDDAFEAYIDPVWEWACRHSWLSVRGGAILSDVYFEFKDGMVELSWDNRNPEDGVTFDCVFGGVRVDAETFKAVVLEFVDAYEKHWGIKVDDDSTWARDK